MLASQHHETFRPPTTPSTRLHCLFTGKVQGVGFRYTVKNIAMCHNVAGYVRNLPDGKVELVMEGPAEEMDQIIDSVKHRMAHYIKQIDRNPMPPTGEFDHFQIRH